jgi:RNA polymerase sigma-70 factor (ECF subfamily)
MDDRSHSGLNGYAARLIQFKARQLSRRPGFSRTDRGDLEQELWADLLGRLPRFDPAKASLNTFIARVVERKIASILRYHLAEMRSPGRNEASLNDPALDCDGRVVERHQTTPEAASTRQRLDDLRRDLAEVREYLPSDVLRAIMDAIGLGGTINSIAGELGISRRTAERHMAELRRIFVDAGLRDYL